MEARAPRGHQQLLGALVFEPHFGAVAQQAVRGDVEVKDLTITLDGRTILDRISLHLRPGTVTAIVDGGNVEITTLRKDVSTDGRRATIACSCCQRHVRTISKPGGCRNHSASMRDHSAG